MATKTIQLTAQKRNELGSRPNKRLRDRGMVPGVIYGHKEAVIPIALNSKEVSTHLSHGAHVFDVVMDGKAEKVLVKEVQMDHLGLHLLHVDFARVSLDEKVKLTVELQLKGEPIGEKEGAVLQQIINELEIECLVTDIPDVITHDVTEMAKDSVLHIRELKLPPGVKVLQDPELIVAQVREVLEAAPAEPAAEGAAEPEVIARKKEDDDSSAEEAK
jgi:large subunit ribosomal protein L25